MAKLLEKQKNFDSQVLEQTVEQSIVPHVVNNISLTQNSIYALQNTKQTNNTSLKC